jgi:hypothetical protein
MTSLYAAERELENELDLELEDELELERSGPVVTRAEVQKHKTAYDRLMKGVAVMTKHVAVKGGRLHFTLPAASTQEAAAKLGLDHGLFKQLHSSLKARNAHIQRLGPVRKAGPTSRPTINAEMEYESPKCAGVTKKEGHWWGVKVWLDECKTAALVDAMKGGGVGAGALCAILGLQSAMVCAAIAGLGQSGGFLISAVDNYGGKRGVTLTWTWYDFQIGLGIIPIITPQ